MGTSPFDKDSGVDANLAGPVIPLPPPAAAPAPPAPPAKPFVQGLDRVKK